MTTLPNARRQRIIDILENKDYAEVSYLSNLLKVSEMTIRRDLEKLERDGEVIRVYGGVKLKTKRVYEGTIEERLNTHHKEKRIIANEAIKLIEDGDVIAFDASTTALEVSKLIKHFSKLTVVTNNISIAVELAEAKNIAVILLGGFVRGKSLSTIGASLRQFMQSIYIDKAFVSSKALNFREGLTDATIDEGEAKQIMLERSNQVIVMADRSKLDTLAFFKVCSNREINTIITDELAPFTDRQKTCLTDYNSIGTNIIIAK